MEKKHGTGRNFWYNHPIYRPVAYHFLAAIMKKDLDELNGFDERYAYGCGYDDAELIQRIKHNGMDIIIYPYENNPFIIHQYHDKLTQFKNMKNKDINRHIFNKHMDECGINKFYKKQSDVE